MIRSFQYYLISMDHELPANRPAPRGPHAAAPPPPPWPHRPTPLPHHHGGPRTSPPRWNGSSVQDRVWSTSTVRNIFNLGMGENKGSGSHIFLTTGFFDNRKIRTYHIITITQYTLWYNGLLNQILFHSTTKKRSDTTKFSHPWQFLQDIVFFSGIFQSVLPTVCGPCIATATALPSAV